jgi:hypothetical protein
MLTLGPDGTLIEIPPFASATSKILQRLGAKNFGAVPIPQTPGQNVAAFAVMDGWYEIAAGRSMDEACLRLVVQVVDRKVDCTHCGRAVFVDNVDVTTPLDPEVRTYLQEGVPGFGKALRDHHKTCTLYFDHRPGKVEWALSCQGFDPDWQPEEGEDDGELSPLLR